MTETELTARLDGARPGFALVTVIGVLTVLSVLIAAYAATTRVELDAVKATSDISTGFYSAESGLNVRGEKVRAVFQGYTRPSGTSPAAVNACASGNTGTGDFACAILNYNGRRITTYVVEDPRNNDANDADRMITIPPGERFAGLNAIQYRYSVVSEAERLTEDRPEAILEMVFRTRLVPLFQFAAFYDKDLEVLPGPNMTLGGPVHVNGDLYLNVNTGSTLQVNGTVTVGRRGNGTGGGFWRGRKNTNDCTGTVRVNDANAATNPDPAVNCVGGRRQVPQSELNGWNGRIETGLDRVTVPVAAEFEPGGSYWHAADLVLALDLRNGAALAQVIVPNRDFTGSIASITTNTTLTSIVTNCGVPTPTRSYTVYTGTTNPVAHAENRLPDLPGAHRAVEWSNSFRDRRENTTTNQRTAFRVMLEVDVAALMDCLNAHPELFDDGPSVERGLHDTSSGGLVWYLTVLGNYSNAASSGYGVRLRNGRFLGRTSGSAPHIRGLTVVTDQAAFIEGDYNLNGSGGADWRPASVLSDAINILSNNYRTNQSSHTLGTVTNATPTTVNAAFLSGTRTTGNTEGTGGQGGAYNGGLENYPIFHENWGSQTMMYRGSFASLEQPKRSTGAWSGSYYGAPLRDWGYDTRFNNAENLPPMSPRFVYLLQERFVREFNR